MSKLYRIIPLQDNSIKLQINVYSKDKHKNIKTWSVIETYKKGQGFRYIDNPMPNLEDVKCDPQLGWGNNLTELISVDFDFDSKFTSEEINNIVQYWSGIQDSEGRSSLDWLYEGEHNYSIEDEFLLITGPVKVDLALDHTYLGIVKENIELKERLYNEA